MKNIKVLIFYKLINLKNTIYADYLRNHDGYTRSDPPSHEDLSTSLACSSESNRSILGKQI